MEIKLINAQIDNEGNLVENITSKKGSFFDYKLSIIGSLLVISSIGIGIFIPIISWGIFPCLIDVGAFLGGLHLIKKDYFQIKEENEKCEVEKKNLIKHLNIQDLIRFEIKEYLKNKNIGAP